jgi:hypothetical protein
VKLFKLKNTHTKNSNGTKLFSNRTEILQTDELSMGASASAVLAEAYIQNMEHKHMYPILIKTKQSGTLDMWVKTV